LTRKNVLDNAAMAIANGARRLFRNPLAFLDMGDEDINGILARNYARSARPTDSGLMITRLVNDEGRVTVIPGEVNLAVNPPAVVPTPEHVYPVEDTPPVVEETTSTPPTLPDVPFQTKKYIGMHLELDHDEVGYVMIPLDTWQVRNTWKYIPATKLVELYIPSTGGHIHVLPRFYVGVTGYAAGACTSDIWASGVMDPATNKMLDFYYVVPEGTPLGLALWAPDFWRGYTSPPSWGTYGPTELWQDAMFHFSTFVDDPATGFIKPSQPIDPFTFTIEERLTMRLVTASLSAPTTYTIARTFPTSTAEVQWTVGNWEYEPSGGKLFRQGYYSTMHGEASFSAPRVRWVSQSFADINDITRHGYVYVEQEKDYLISAFDATVRRRFSELYYAWEVVDGSYTIDSVTTLTRTYEFFKAPVPWTDFGSNQGFLSYGIVPPYPHPEAVGDNTIAPIEQVFTSSDGFHVVQYEFAPMLWYAQHVATKGTLRAYVCFHDEEFLLDTKGYDTLARGNPRLGPADTEEGTFLDGTQIFAFDPEYTLLPGGTMYLDQTHQGDTYTFFFYSALAMATEDKPFYYDKEWSEQIVYPDLTTISDPLGDRLYKATFGVAKRLPDGTITNEMLTFGAGGEVQDFEGKKFTGFFTIFHGQERI
jgi:hypothetical protein